jgi:hypothetical protein
LIIVDLIMVGLIIIDLIMAVTVPGAGPLTCAYAEKKITGGKSARHPKAHLEGYECHCCFKDIADVLTRGRGRPRYTKLGRVRDPAQVLLLSGADAT